MVVPGICSWDPVKSTKELIDSVFFLGNYLNFFEYKVSVLMLSYYVGTYGFYIF